MAARRSTMCAVTGIVAAGLALFAMSGPAQAGIFERIFGGLSHALRAPERLPDAVRGFAAPFEPRSERATDPSGQVEGGPAKAFCVRTCDGHYFPVLAHPGMSVADACHTFCPASQTPSSPAAASTMRSPRTAAAMPICRTPSSIAGIWSPAAPATAATSSGSRISTSPTTRRSSLAMWWRPPEAWPPSPAARTGPRSSHRPPATRISLRTIAASSPPWRAARRAEPFSAQNRP